MSGVIEVGGVILSHAFERAEVAAQNLTNITTSGYKAARWSPPFSVGDDSLLTAQTSAPDRSIDFSAGQLKNTGNPFDLAIEGSGFFVVRSGENEFYTRDGQFTRNADGNLITADGAVLQSATGGDVTIATATPKILSDGTIVENGQPVAQVGIVDVSDKSLLERAVGGLFAAPSGAASAVSPRIQQGMLETSNVSSADEMIAIMAALRSAESGQKLVQAYDDLLGRVLNMFGQS